MQRFSVLLGVLVVMMIMKNCPSRCMFVLKSTMGRRICRSSDTAHDLRNVKTSLASGNLQQRHSVEYPEPSGSSLDCQSSILREPYETCDYSADESASALRRTINMLKVLEDQLELDTDDANSNDPSNDDELLQCSSGPALSDTLTKVVSLCQNLDVDVNMPQASSISPVKQQLDAQPPNAKASYAQFCISQKP